MTWFRKPTFFTRAEIYFPVCKSYTYALFRDYKCLTTDGNGKQVIIFSQIHENFNPLKITPSVNSNTNDMLKYSYLAIKKRSNRLCM